MAASPCLIMGIRGHWLIILTLIWWFQKNLLMTLPTTAPTCFVMTNERKARMWMQCATCSLCTIPISSRRCLSASKWRPRSWWSSSTIVSGRTSHNLSCNSLPCFPSRFTLRLCWFTWSLDIPTTVPIGSSCGVIMRWRAKTFTLQWLSSRLSTRSKESTWSLLTIVTLSAFVTSVGIESWRSISINFQLDIHSTTCSSSIRASWAWDRWVQPQTVRLCTSHWSRHPVWTWWRDQFFFICLTLVSLQLSM